jgi:transcriptional regulator with XRE-family HTH domain
MEEHELRRILSANIKRFRGRREWSQVILAEKLGISTNFLADIETGKSWVSSQTLVKIANILDIEVFELFLPENRNQTAKSALPFEMKEYAARFVKDMSIAVTQSVNSALNQSLENVTKQYFV